jgi:hypothetical protein
MSDIYSLARQYLTPVEIELCFFEAFKKMSEEITFKGRYAIC